MILFTMYQQIKNIKESDKIINLTNKYPSMKECKFPIGECRLPHNCFLQF